jgi:NAD(P)-dependent dehydrogenase (short-subunit alcohol dehydrogenase family)
MDLHLSGKIAVVTGASKGIGLAITQALVDAGAHAIAGSRTRGPKLGELEEAGKVTFVSADLSSKALSKELGPKNIRVNSISPGPVSTGM